MRPQSKLLVLMRAGHAARRLGVEMLEDRRLLSASQYWHNPVYPLDVTGDGVVTPMDLSALQAHLLLFGVQTAPPATPGTQPDAFYDVTGDGLVTARDALVLLDRLSTPTVVTMATAVPATATDPSPSSVDVTPQLRINATSPAKLPDGRVVEVDVDLDNNGSFTGNELNYAQGVLYNGAATFDLTPALPQDNDGQPYSVHLRAHVQDSDGVIGYSPMQSLTINTAPSDVLKNYVAAPDSSYTYSIAQTTHFSGQIGSLTIPNLYTVYDVKMRSQTWRTTDDVDNPEWWHWVRIIVPNAALVGPLHSTALFLIDGGSFKDQLPTTSFGNDSTFGDIGQAAVQLRSVVIDLQDVPNEPLTFTGDPGDPRSEDDIIAYTFNQYVNNLEAGTGGPDNDTWPALLPMVKSAVRGMDTVQALGASTFNTQIDNFMVTGYSKRGWTTWLTAAVDPRVVAIIPGVFDNLDQAAQMVHQYQVYGFFSQAVQPYNDFNIFQRIATPAGQQLSSIVDPYYYLNDPRMTMPKLLINSAGDEFFVSDSAQYYIHDLPGSQNYLRYLPNDGHGLDDVNPLESTLTFYDAVVNQKPLPRFSWVVEPDGSIQVKTVDTPTQVKVWSATNPLARDFRHLFTTPPLQTPPVVWTSSDATSLGNGVYTASESTPATGATAFFIELTFPSTIGTPFVFTTEIHVDSNQALYDWPPPLNPVAGVTPIALPVAVAASAASLPGGGSPSLPGASPIFPGGTATPLASFSSYLTGGPLPSAAPTPPPAPPALPTSSANSAAAGSSTGTSSATATSTTTTKTAAAKPLANADTCAATDAEAVDAVLVSALDDLDVN